MEANLTNALFEYVQERDRNEFALGDVLDVKTGLVLAGLTFLAIQSGDFIKPGLPLCQMVAQIISVSALVVGGILAVCELWPRDYDREATPEKYEAWFADTDKYKAEHPETALCRKHYHTHFAPFLNFPFCGGGGAPERSSRSGFGDESLVGRRSVGFGRSCFWSDLGMVWTPDENSSNHNSVSNGKSRV